MQVEDAVSRYAHLRNELLGCLDLLSSTQAAGECPCSELREKLTSNTFNLVVVGQFKRGKTSLINAMLGADVLPVAVVPLTSIATVLTYGEELTVTVHFNDGRAEEVPAENLADYVTEKGNPENRRDVSEVVVTYPSEYLKDGVRIIDTPGVGSVYQHNTDVAYRYLPRCDAALFLLSVDQPAGKAELDFLRDVSEHSEMMFFILNKADYLSDAEVKEAVSFTRGMVEEAMGPGARIFPVSARLALEARRTGSPELLERSNFPLFSAELGRFLMEEKGKAQIRSVANNMLRAIGQGMLGLDIGLKSLATPVEELKAKIEAFEKKKKETVADRDDFVILLEGEVQRIVRSVLNEDIEAFKKGLVPVVEKSLEEFYAQNRHRPLKELHEALESSVTGSIKRAFNVWRVEEDSKLAGEFEASCRRFILRINDTVDALLAFSSRLFSVAFEAVKAEALWTAKSGFYFKFKDEPVGLEMLTSSLTLALPRFVGRKVILKKMRQFAREAAEIQSGRVRYDFAERLDKSKLDFRREMLQRIEATVEGISVAITRGMADRDKGEREAAGRAEALLAEAARLEAARQSLLQLRQQVL
jgi:GTPase SAR1 family protein